MEGMIVTNVNFGGNPLEEKKRRWQITVRVNLLQGGDIKPTYLGHVECIGIFSVASNVPEGKIEKLVMVNGTGILYASIREMISNITARGPWPLVNLVTQSFSVGYEEGKTREKEVAAKKV
jgi:preprotein translocase subunit SecB